MSADPSEFPGEAPFIGYWVGYAGHPGTDAGDPPTGRSECLLQCENGRAPRVEPVVPPVRPGRPIPGYDRWWTWGRQLLIETFASDQTDQRATQENHGCFASVVPGEAYLGRPGDGLERRRGNDAVISTQGRGMTGALCALDAKMVQCGYVGRTPQFSGSPRSGPAAAP